MLNSKLESNRGNYYGWLHSCCRLDIWYLILCWLCTWYLFTGWWLNTFLVSAWYLIFDTSFMLYSIATVFTENNHDGWIHSFCRLDTCPFFFCCTHLHTGWLPGEIFKFYSGLVAMQCNVPRIFESHKCCVWLSPYVNIVTFVHCSLSEQPRAGYKLHVTI